MEKVEILEKMEDFARGKRHKLFERISLFATLMGLFHFSQDFLSGARVIPFIDLFITIVLFSAFLLHRSGHPNAARIVGLSFLNLCFLVYACIVPAEVGIYLFYFPLIAISMSVFDPGEKVTRNFFVILSGTLLVSLFLSDFDLIGSYAIEVKNVKTDFIINLISSTFILVVSVSFVLGLNVESEKRLHLMAEEIRLKNSNLEKTNAELDRFFYSTSHDLRSPLLSIKGLINIASNETTEARVTSYLSMMADRVDKLDHFIKDIIDYSKNARTEVVREQVNLFRIVEDVRQNLQFLEGAEKIQFQTEIDTEDALIDKTRLNIILNNLSSNAVKYHNHDAPNPWIKVSIHIADNMLRIGVSDNGPGICAERQTKIFDMFYRGTERSNGSGLGLYIVKETITKMAGSIDVDSVEGQGTSFSVNLPLSTKNVA